MTELFLFILTGLLCGLGILLSALSFSGTWVVLGSAVLTWYSIGVPTPGILLVFLLICIATEVLEAIAGYHGVQKRGGSKLAGLAALLGGLLGMIAGSAVIPILGTFLGMLLGSFALAYLSEWLRLKHHETAAHIARGAVWARLRVMFLKTALTAAMSLWLLLELLG